jgi:3-deoxy-D-manno-octulosonate 8-phosphate phosphatase (KDO 8-P phosphatase)
MQKQIVERAKKIKALVCDVDGVLTDRKLYIPETDDMIRAFDVQDGYGMRMWIRLGKEGVVLSGGRSSVIKKRAQMLGINHIYMANENKIVGYEDFLSKSGFPETEVAFIADDLFDLQVFERVGLAIAVGDAHPILKRKAHWVTQAKGGQGAIREVVDALLYYQSIHPYQSYFEEDDLQVSK